MVEIAHPALQRLFTALPSARLVGGAVRDGLLGLPVADIDLAVPLPPATVMQTLRAAGIEVVPTGLKHGTVTAVIAGRGYEITSLRRDVATDGRHAQVAYTSDWQEDAARRDFTFNALSMDQSGQIYDYFDGRADLAAGRVRFVGDPAARVAEDYLRILRFFRFHARFGQAPPDPAALAAITAAVPGLAQLSAERIWHELKALLASPNPVPSLTLMRQTNVLDSLLPGGADIEAVRRLGEAEPLLRFAALAKDAPSYASRFKMAKSEATLLTGYAQARPPATTAGDDDLRRALEETPPAYLIGASRLRGDPQAFQARLATIPRPIFPLHGRDALHLGLPPGEPVGQALAALRLWWRDGGCIASATQCRAELARRLRGV